jgi:hypothetical protein
MVIYFYIIINYIYPFFIIINILIILYSTIYHQITFIYFFFTINYI